MIKKNKNKDKKDQKQKTNVIQQIEKGILNGIVAIVLFALVIIFVLSAFNGAGVVGTYTFKFFSHLFGIGYFLIPLVLFLVAVSLLKQNKREMKAIRIVSSIMLFVSSLGLIELASKQKGGVIGNLIAAPMLKFFDFYASAVILVTLLTVSVILLFEKKITLDTILFWRKWNEKKSDEYEYEEYEKEEEKEKKGNEQDEEKNKKIKLSGLVGTKNNKNEEEEELQLITDIPAHREYIPPPLSLLQKDKGRPDVGDVKANANIIKRTMQNFGIDVEMDEVSIGPTVTRYSLKPAEGVRLSKIVSLQNNLELALAAHPVRIEAPIPGKSLIGIEVPNTSKTTVGLGGLLSSQEFQESAKSLLIALGKDIAGKPHFGDLSKMPHLLIAGATGSGKSVTIHAIINSLLFRNSPENIKFIMIDPKRVELTLYNGIPHLLTPVITDYKKTILALKWAAREMERRYDILEKNAVRDTWSYHKNILSPALEKYRERKSKGGIEDKKESELPERMPYIIIIIDELADIMQMYPRELEAAVVRLAQMSRATGIHLILSTQRPSVNVITGLIKANISTRIALQVASQVDSRTILDTIGAEKLLGAGDMLYISGEMSKPVRLQSAFISEKDVKAVTKYLNEEYENELPYEIDISAKNQENLLFPAPLEEDFGDDDLYEEAREIVIRAGKASTSYLQRKLRIGYSRAARLMDMLEERGVIGAAQGSRPRDIIVKREESGDGYGYGKDNNFIEDDFNS